MSARAHRPSSAIAVSFSWIALLGGLLGSALAGCDSEPESADNHPPTFQRRQVTIQEDSTVTLTLLEGAEDLDGDALSTRDLVVSPSSASVTFANGTAVVTPAPNFHGTLDVIYSVWDGRAKVTASIEVIVQPVNDAPIAKAASRRLRKNAVLVLEGSDLDGDPLTYEIVELPAHGQLDGTPPNLVFTAEQGYVGADRFTYRVSDGKATSEVMALDLDLFVGSSPVPNDRSLLVNEDGSLDVVLTASDVDGDPLAFSVQVPPSHGALTGTPPNLVYRPAADYHGPDSLTFVVDDDVEQAVTGTISFNVLPVNDAPVAAPQTVSATEDLALQLTLAGSDVDNGVLTYEVVLAPSHGTLTGTGAVRTYTPSPNYHGPDTFAYRVRDGFLVSSSAAVTLAIAPVPDAPVATPFAVAAVEDQATAFLLLGGDGDGDAPTYQLLSSPAHGTLSGTAPTLVYTPEPNYFGPDTFTYDVSAGGETSAAGTVTVNVAGRNDAPVVQDGAVTTAEDTAVAISLVGSDIDGAAPRFVIVSSPIDGVMTGSGASLTYTPAPNANGTRTLAFAAYDVEGLGDSGVITIEITPVNDPPTATLDIAMTEAATALTLEVAANDVDVDGDALALTGVGSPAHGTAALEGDDLVYTPAAGFTGIDELTYTVVDEHDEVATGTVRVGVGVVPPGVPQESLPFLAGNLFDLDLSEDSRILVFSSPHALLPADTNGFSDIYSYDRITRVLSRVSLGVGGAQANGGSVVPSVSGSGRYVVFQSSATNLVAEANDLVVDVFRHDRVTGQTVLVSVSSGGARGNGPSKEAQLSDDGNVIAFTSLAFNLAADDFNGADDVFVRDVAAGTTVRASTSSTGSDGDGNSFSPAISGNGQLVAFTSSSTNLVVGDSNTVTDVFLRDLGGGVLRRISVTSTGVQADEFSTSPSISRDGRFVSFLSAASNLSPPYIGFYTYAYVHDAQASTTIRADQTFFPSAPCLSSDGRYLTLGTSNGGVVRDRFAAVTAPLQPPLGRTWSQLVISGNGRYIMLLQGTSTLILLPNPL